MIGAQPHALAGECKELANHEEAQQLGACFVIQRSRHFRFAM